MCTDKIHCKTQGVNKADIDKDSPSASRKFTKAAPTSGANTKKGEEPVQPDPDKEMVFLFLWLWLLILKW